MEIYNHYINTALNNGRYSEYKSEISFIKLDNNSIQIYDLFFIRFYDNVKFKDNFFKKSDTLQKLFWANHKNNTTPNIDNKYIKSLQPSTQHYSFIKVINDKQNPHLNGKILILKYGRKLLDILKSNFSKNVYLNIASVQLGGNNYFNWDKCQFSDIDCDLYDENLNISDFINFKEFDPIKEERKEKLIEIQKLNY